MLRCGETEHSEDTGRQADQGAVQSLQHFDRETDAAAECTDRQLAPGPRRWARHAFGLHTRGRDGDGCVVPCGAIAGAARVHPAASHSHRRARIRSSALQGTVTTGALLQEDAVLVRQAGGRTLFWFSCFVGVGGDEFPAVLTSARSTPPLTLQVPAQMVAWWTNPPSGPGPRQLRESPGCGNRERRPAKPCGACALLCVHAPIAASSHTSPSSPPPRSLPDPDLTYSV